MTMETTRKIIGTNKFGWIGIVVSVLLIILLSLLYFFLLLRPPLYDLGLMTLLLTTTAAISTMVGFLLYRLGWLGRFPAVRWMLLAGYLLSGLLTFFNVFVTAQLMFTDQHDLHLGTVLLIFATGIAAVIGYLTSKTIVDRLSRLQESAQMIAKGDFNVRTNLSGKDELAQLAATFNQMAEQLQQAENKQLEADNLRRELIVWISHDLQTPLSSIQAMVEALADDVVSDQETTKRYLKNIQRQVNALSSLIDDLFQLAQYDAGGLKLDIVPDSFSDLASAVISSLSGLAARKNISINLHTNYLVKPIPMDTLQIGRVLNNLLMNALNHTPGNGTIDVFAERQERQILITVSDSGRGIEPEDIPHIFDRFYRGEKSRSRLTGGAGLGLAIAKGIVEAHQGEISVQSTPGIGTKITFSLPLFP